MIKKVHEPTSINAYLYELEHRIHMEQEDYLKFVKYKKGYEGELKFFEMIEQLDGDFVVLWDINFVRPVRVQYDFIIITSKNILHFDIKNYSGNYRYQNNRLISEHGKTDKDIFIQLDNANAYLNQLIAKYEMPQNLISKIIFINEDLNLTGFNGKDCVMFAHELKAVFNYLKTCKGITQQMKNFADALIQMHDNEGIEKRIHYYNIDEMKLGLRCPKCRKIEMWRVAEKQYLQCSCGYKILNHDIILAAYETLRLLGMKKIQRKDIVAFTGISVRTVARYANKLFNKKSKHRGRIMREMS
ncbi:nuclease-related domain-containing protein [Macrococcus armenti]|uniref:nuclease-related domain-containing protein n=1 Tax=Macrococcus armenti TaxID=2875764 RepID=UPI001CCB318F|nr:nuclease-related domain-containing protein [Macrococcus armenti]UBH09061.1 NERD domain-containing protein [Macrococcus armenti]